MQKICIYGLGAIGGLIAGRLALAGQAVSAIARGTSLEAIRHNGLTVLEGQTGQSAPLHVEDNPTALGVQDVVILSVKTSAMPDVAKAIGPLIGTQTVIVSAMNGIPWWFLHGLKAAPAGLTLESVDPQGVVSQAIPAAQVLGCVTHLSATVPQPGQVRQVAGNRLILGAPTGALSAPQQRIVQLLQLAGFDVETSDSIQAEIWFKLWGNMTMNPVSLLTGATGDQILDDPYIQDFMSRCMVEAAAIGEHIGLPIHMTPQERHQVTRKLGAFKTSMLQDLEVGKPVELDALLRVVIELGQQVSTPTPNLAALMGLARLKASNLGLYTGRH